jgi:hypothetical protein
MCIDYSSATGTPLMAHSSSVMGAERSPARSAVLGHPVAGMTSRTTPVGILVLALASLIAVGCSAPTSAVFQALVDPAGAPLSSPEADTAADPAAESSESAMWWPHPDGYAMVLPAGWSGVAVEPADTARLIDAIDAGMPGLASRMGDVLDRSEARVSAIAADPDAQGDVTPVLVVLAQPTEGKRAHAIKTRVREQINAVPGLSGLISPHDVTLPTAKGVRYDYTIDDPDLGELRVRSYLFRFGRQAYLVNFIAPEAGADEAEAIFDAIADSLRFGV